MFAQPVIVPIDFSECLLNALKYAVALAKQSRSKIILAHSLYNSLAEVRINPGNKTSGPRKKALDELKRLAHQVKLSDGLAVVCITAAAALPQMLINLIKVKKAGLVVMGTKGAKGITDFIWDSWAAEVIRSVNRPVIVVPEKAVWSGFSRMVFSTSLNKSDLPAIGQVVEMARAFEAHLEILHISSSETISDDENKKMDHFVDLVESETSLTDLTYRILAGKNIEKTLRQYLSKRKVSILAVSTRNRNWIERIFEKSIAHQLVLNIHVPLMVFHYEQTPVYLI